MKDWLNYLRCLAFGHAEGPRLMATVADPTMPKGWRYAVVCSRCKTCEPLAPMQQDLMIKLQMKGAS